MHCLEMPCPLTPDFLASNLDTVKGELDRVSQNQDEHHRTSQIGKLMHLVPPFISTYEFGRAPAMLFTVVLETPKYIHLKMTYDDVLKYEETIDLLKKSLEHEPTDDLFKNERKELLQEFQGITKFLSAEPSPSRFSGEKVIVFGCQHILTSSEGEIRPLMFDIQRIHH